MKTKINPKQMIQQAFESNSSNKPKNIGLGNFYKVNKKNGTVDLTKTGLFCSIFNKNIEKNKSNYNCVLKKMNPKHFADFLTKTNLGISAIGTELDANEAALILKGMEHLESASILRKMTLPKACLILEKMTPHEAASILGKMTIPEACSILEKMTPPEAASILENMSIPKALLSLEKMTLPEAALILENMTIPKACSILEKMTPPEAASILKKMEPETANKILLEIGKENPNTAVRISLNNLDKNTSPIHTLPNTYLKKAIPLLQKEEVTELLEIVTPNNYADIFKQLENNQIKEIIKNLGTPLDLKVLESLDSSLQKEILSEKDFEEFLQLYNAGFNEKNSTTQSLKKLLANEKENRENMSESN
jgi:Mg/Co/Ni transporter MgtE